jgi:glycosyltransferase involved in cell wall biosynthesis
MNLIDESKKAKAKQTSALPRNSLRKLKSLGSVDIVVGIPSYNCAHTVNYVIYQAAKGLAEFFPDLQKVIVVSDGGSSDGTVEVASSIKLPWDVKVITTDYVGTRGKGTALRAVFETLMHLNAQATMVVDSDLRSIVPEWVHLLLSSILEGTDLVTPLYERHKYDGTITNFLCYPFTRALYGRRIRQPIGGDFGLSKKLVVTLLSSSLWNNPYVPRFGIDIFITHTSLGKDFSVKQAFLGAKIHETKDPSKDLASMFHEVLGSMFSCTREYENVWQTIRGSGSVELIKGNVPVTAPEEVKVQAKNVFEAYKKGFQTYQGYYKKALSPDLFHSVQVRSSRDLSRFQFPNESWAKCVYSFASEFKKRQNLEEKKTLLDSLRVLWIGKVASFIIQTSKTDSEKPEEQIEKNADTFEELKPFLIDKYQEAIPERSDIPVV